MIHLYSVCCDTDKNYMKTGGTGIYLSQLCKSNHPHSELWLGVNNDVYSVSQGSGSLLVLFTGGLSLFEQQLSWYYFLNQTSSIKAAELNQSSLQKYVSAASDCTCIILKFLQNVSYHVHTAVRIFDKTTVYFGATSRHHVATESWSSWRKSRHLQPGL